MSARDEVLARIRAANTHAGNPAAPTIPRDYRRKGKFAPGSDEVLELLTDRLIDYRAQVIDVRAGGVDAALGSAENSATDPIPAAIAAALSSVDGPVLVPAGLPAGWCPQGVPDTGFSPTELDGFAAVVTACAAACATTGTIALDAGPDQGRRALTLVPDVHVCVVRAEQVVETVPELLARLDPVRPTTFISGPSATSDIELERVEGVHGPRTLIVVLA